jgi:hypothetical protein
MTGATVRESPPLPGSTAPSEFLGSFWSGRAKPSFFLMIAAVAIAASAVIWAFDRPLRTAPGRGV